MNPLSSSRSADISSQPTRRIRAAGLLMFCLLMAAGIFLSRQSASLTETHPAPPALSSKDLPGPTPEAPSAPDPATVTAIRNSTNGWKTGTVDMARIFREYHKTREAERRLNEDKTKAKNELEARSAKQRELALQLKELDKVLADRLVNEALKQQKRLGAEALLQEYRRLTADLQEFAGRRERQLQDQSGRLRKALLDEILGHLQEKAKRDGYDFVFDKSGHGISGSPLLLVTREAMDFTSEMILELNRQAPVAKTGSAGN